MLQTSFQIVKLLNEARTKPRDTAKIIRNQLKPCFRGNDLYTDNKKIETFQGEKALDDMVLYMSAISSSAPLSQSYPLSGAANYIAQVKGKYGLTDHEKPQRIYEILKNYGSVDGKIGQLFCLKASKPQQIVKYFLIDDGLSSRKRRRMLLDPTYRYIGIGVAPHLVYGTITVILLADRVNSFGQNSQLRSVYESQLMNKKNSLILKGTEQRNSLILKETEQRQRAQKEPEFVIQ